MIFSSYDRARLSVELVGEGPTVICLPGGPGRAAAYLEDLGGLGASRRLALLDGRGSGRSPFPDDPATLAFPAQAGDVEALRAELGVDKVTVLGHSAGTLVAMAYAAAHADRLEALVLVTPTGRMHGVDHPDVAAIRAARSGEPWYAEAHEAEQQMADAPRGMQAELEKAQRPFFYGSWDDRVQEHAASADRQMSPRATLGFAPPPGFDAQTILSSLSQVTAPVLVVAGSRDGLTGVEAAHAVARGFPNAETAVLEGAGHFPWVDEPDAFRTAVLDFLDR